MGRGITPGSLIDTLYGAVIMLSVGLPAPKLTTNVLDFTILLHSELETAS